MMGDTYASMRQNSDVVCQRERSKGDEHMIKGVKGETRGDKEESWNDRK